MRFRVGVRLDPRWQPLSRALAMAASWHAEGVLLEARGPLSPRELSQTGRRQIRKQLADHGLKLAGLVFPTRGGYADEEGIDRRVRGTKDALDLAYELGANVVINRIGRVPATDDHPDWARFQESLTDIGRYSQKAGALFTARTGTEDGESLARLITALPEGCLSVDLDPAALLIQGYSIDRALDALLPWIAHVEARDATRDPAVGRSVEVPLGRGSVPLAEIAASLDTRGYRGYVSVDCCGTPHAERESGDAVEYLRAIRVA